MSNVTSQSELTTKEIVEQAIQDYHNTILPYLAKGNNGYSETPIGAMQMFDDDTAPSGWLVADGTIYNISDYPFLANHFERVHGSKNYYGGDGTTTFAVPDWQGEFFRASGTNAHPNQGNGAAVGEHQDATEIPFLYAYGNGDLYISKTVAVNKTDSNYGASNYINLGPQGGSGSTSDSMYNTKTTCPTSTSLLCCIKAVPAGINYSLEEQEIGTWMNKKLYMKTIAGLKTPSAIDTDVTINLSSWNIDTCVEVNGMSNVIDVSPCSDYGTQAITVFYSTNSKLLYIRNNNYPNDYNKDIYVTIKYTKTSD